MQMIIDVEEAKAAAEAAISEFEIEAKVKKIIMVQYIKEYMNIEFDFNKDDDYWPCADQADEYPGAVSYRDPYFMRFFAGITVKADYVTIDLNGQELKQSTTFHYQQRWFAKQFLPVKASSKKLRTVMNGHKQLNSTVKWKYHCVFFVLLRVIFVSFEFDYQISVVQYI